MVGGFWVWNQWKNAEQKFHSVWAKEIWVGNAILLRCKTFERSKVVSAIHSFVFHHCDFRFLGKHFEKNNSSVQLQGHVIINKLRSNKPVLHKIYALHMFVRMHIYIYICVCGGYMYTYMPRNLWRVKTLMDFFKCQDNHSRNWICVYETDSKDLKYKCWVGEACYSKLPLNISKRNS